MRVYVLAGALCGLASMLDLSRFATTNVAGHTNDALAAVAGAVIGGTSLFGGRASVIGAVFGALLAVILQTGLVADGLTPFYQQVAVGVVLITAVYADRGVVSASRRGAHLTVRKCQCDSEVKGNMSRKHSFTETRDDSAWLSPGARRDRSQGRSARRLGTNTLHGSRALSPRHLIPYFISMKCGALAAIKEGRRGQPDLARACSTKRLAADHCARVGRSHEAGRRDSDSVLADCVSTAGDETDEAGDPSRTDRRVPLTNAAYSEIYTDVSHSGPVLAKSIAALIGGKGELGIVAFGAGDPFETPRYAGMVKVIKAKYPNVTVLPVQYAAADSNKAAQVVSGVLAAHPNLKAIYATDGPMGQGAAAALRTAGKRGDVKLISFDAEPALVTEVSATAQSTRSMAQAPYIEGYNAMTSLFTTSAAPVPPRRR